MMIKRFTDDDDDVDPEQSRAEHKCRANNVILKACTMSDKVIITQFIFSNIQLW